MEVLEERTLLSAGQLDPAFGTNGTATISFLDSGNNAASAVAAQTDGKLVVAGNSATDLGIGALDQHISLARYNADGSLDTSFGNSGTVVTDLGMAFTVVGVAIQDDGSILVGGTIGPIRIPSQTLFGAVRYTSSGVRDTAFGTGGLVSTAFAANGGATASALTLLSGGRFLIVGTTDGAAQPMFPNFDFALAAYNSGGTLDASFGSGGKIVTDLGGRNDHANAAVIDGNGFIVVAGTSDATPLNGDDFALARYTPQGLLGQGFGASGVVYTNLGGDDVAERVVTQSDGKIVAAGRTGSELGMARYNPDGSLDTSFNGNGLVTSSIVSGVMGLAIHGNGIVVGSSSANPPSEGALVAVRFNTSDGSLDTMFGSGGVASATFGSQSFPSAADLLVQGTSIVQVGATNSVQTGSDFAVVRYLASGSLDSSFSGNGIAVTDLPDLVHHTQNAVLSQPDGTVVVAATVGDFGQVPFRTNFGLTRLNPDGSVDTSFGVNGQVITDFFGRDGLTDNGVDVVNGAVRQSDGKIVVVGGTGVFVPGFGSLSHDSNRFERLVLARYNPDGSLDASFGAGGEVFTAFPVEDFGSVKDVELQSDGKILVLESATSFALVRYNADGSLDSSFGTGGVKSLNFGTQLALEPDGRIVVAGIVNFSVLGFARLNSDGSPDTSFGSGGQVITGVGNGFLSPPPVRALTVQPDTKIVVAVDLPRPVNPQDMAFAGIYLFRLYVNGNVDPTFGGGQIFIPDATTTLQPIALAVRADDRIVLLVDNEPIDPQIAPTADVWFVDPNGGLDGLLPNGEPVSEPIGSPSAMTLQADSKILVADSNGVSRLLSNDPLPTANQRFVAQAYLDLLQRTVEPGGLTYWSGLLDNNQATRQEVASAIEASSEYRRQQVESLFALLLGRAASGTEVSAYGQFLAFGGTIEQAEATIIGSPEYFANRAHNTNDGFVDALYQDALQRPADAIGRANIDGALASGTLTRTQAAAGILGSTEYFTDLVDSMYQGFLQRPVDATGLSNALVALSGGARDEAIVAGVVGSDEYLAERT